VRNKQHYLVRSPAIRLSWLTGVVHFESEPVERPLGLLEIPSAVASCSGDNLEALVGKRPHKQRRENALAADTLGEFLKSNIFEDTARARGRLGEDGEGGGRGIR
jgi:hypothetical protein